MLKSIRFTYDKFCKVCRSKIFINRLVKISCAKKMTKIAEKPRKKIQF